MLHHLTELSPSAGDTDRSLISPTDTLQYQTMRAGVLGTCFAHLLSSSAGSLANLQPHRCNKTCITSLCGSWWTDLPGQFPTLWTTKCYTRCLSDKRHQLQNSRICHWGSQQFTVQHTSNTMLSSQTIGLGSCKRYIWQDSVRPDAS